MSSALHESLGLAAQRYLDEPTETQAIQRESYEAIEASRGHITDSAQRDPAYAILQEARMRREISIAAISRLIGDQVTRTTLSGYR